MIIMIRCDLMTANWEVVWRVDPLS